MDDIASVQPWRVGFPEIRGFAAAVDNPDPSGGFPGPMIRIHPQRIISFGVDPDDAGFSKRTVNQTSDG